MESMRRIGRSALVVVVSLLAACARDSTSPRGTAVGCAPAVGVPAVTPSTLATLGEGPISSRYTAEVDARGTTAYTTTWSNRTPGAIGNAVFIWDVSGSTPVLVDSLIVPSASTLGDIAISDDGSLLVVATEFTGGSIVLYDISAPRSPTLVSRFTSAETDPGVHTSEIGRINGRLYGFLSIDPRGSTPAKLVIVDLGDPANPQRVFSESVGTPFVHDTFLRDGILFLALWDAGIQIVDVGGAGNGSPSSPRVISSVATVHGSAHNVWWYHDPA